MVYLSYLLRVALPTQLSQSASADAQCIHQVHQLTPACIHQVAEDQNQSLQRQLARERASVGGLQGALIQLQQQNSALQDQLAVRLALLYPAPPCSNRPAG